jgi:anti-sigma factor RsiW
MNDSNERSDPWLERLSEYIDEELPTGERRELEEHLRGCVECAETLDELRHLIAQVPALEVESEPGVDLWPGIERRLTPRQPARWRAWPAVRSGWLVPRLAAAAALAVAACVVLVWYSPFGANLRPGRLTATGSLEHGWAVDPDQEYESRVAALEREARARLTLDPHVVDVLEENLATLDVAIANYRDVLSKEPDDALMQKRLEAARQRKLDVLQHAVALASEGTD